MGHKSLFFVCFVLFLEFAIVYFLSLPTRLESCGPVESGLGLAPETPASIVQGLNVC